MSFDAFGKRRDPDWVPVNDPTGYLSPDTTRGYAGHEQIDPVGLIHMNRRVYDPEIGRFTSADPIIQDPYLTQSPNRYSYVLNNPLSYTDPTGFRLENNNGTQAENVGSTETAQQESSEGEGGADNPGGANDDSDGVDDAAADGAKTENDEAVDNDGQNAGAGGDPINDNDDGNGDRASRNSRPEPDPRTEGRDAGDMSRSPEARPSLRDDLEPGWAEPPSSRTGFEGSPEAQPSTRDNLQPGWASPPSSRTGFEGSPEAQPSLRDDLQPGWAEPPSSRTGSEGSPGLPKSKPPSSGVLNTNQVENGNSTFIDFPPEAPFPTESVVAGFILGTAGGFAYSAQASFFGPPGWVVVGSAVVGGGAFGTIGGLAGMDTYGGYRPGTSGNGGTGFDDTP